jgi:hypothetical protein
MQSRPEIGVSLLTGIKEGTEEIDSVEITRSEPGSQNKIRFLASM